MRNIHLICNAHLDPIWQWTWDEGISSAIATYKSAADLADEFDYIFCHNEALIYEVIEKNAPQLFERIKKLVKAGKWVVAGGWYLQPDCLMPSGESIIRQIKVGQDYFYKKFGVKSEVAVNYDSFGHSIGLVQILKKCGYKGYMSCRPNRLQFNAPSRFFNWVAPDGSSVIMSISSSYNSRLGEAVLKIKGYIESIDQGMLGSSAGGSVEKSDVDYVLWGVGNHGGGPSRKDLKDIAELKMDGVNIMHSTPEKLFADNINVKGEVRTSIVTCMPGCYSSMARIKRAHRETENLLYSTETMLSVAKMCGYKPDIGDLEGAVKSFLLGEFHDILPGTVVKDGEENGLQLFNYAKKVLSDHRTGAFLYMTMNSPVAEEGEFPLFVFNYMPYKVRTNVEFEFSLADQNWSTEFEYEPCVFLGDKELACQQIKERSTLNLDWRKRVIFDAELEPLGMTRYSVRVKKVPKKNKNFGLGDQSEVCRAFVNDVKMPLTLLSYEDSADPWAMSIEELKGVGKNPAEFLPMTEEEASAFCAAEKTMQTRIIEDGKIVRSYECLYTYGKTNAVIEYKIYKNQQYTDIKITLEFADKNRLVRVKIPMPKGVVVGDGPYIVEEKPTVGEMSFQKWVGVKSEGGNITAIINDCVYGGKVSDGAIELTLVRGAGYCFHPIHDRELYPKDRYLPRIDSGRYEYNLRLYTGTVAEVCAEAELFARAPYAVNVFPTGGNTGKVAVEVDKNVVVGALIPSDDGMVIRLWNPADKAVETNVRVGEKTAKVTLGINEIVSLKVTDKIVVCHDEILM